MFIILEGNSLIKYDEVYYVVIFFFFLIRGPLSGWRKIKPFPSPGDLPNPGVEPVCPATAGRFSVRVSSGKSSSVFLNHRGLPSPNAACWCLPGCSFKCAKIFREEAPELEFRLQPNPYLDQPSCHSLQPRKNTVSHRCGGNRHFSVETSWDPILEPMVVWQGKRKPLGG